MAQDKRYVCIDLEMSSLTSGEKQLIHGISKEVIQIGAVMLDKNYNVISRFQTFVKPSYSHITPEIEELTGIHQYCVDNADDFITAFDKYVAWVGDTEITTFCWDSIDYRQLWDELRIKVGNRRSDLYDYLEHFVDLQKTFCDLINANKNIALDTAVQIIGDEFKGTQHQALSDAFNTAAVLHKVCCTDSLNPVFTPLNVKNDNNEKEEPKEQYTSSMASFFSPDLLASLGFKVNEALNTEDNTNQNIEEDTQGEDVFMDDESQDVQGINAEICSKYGIPHGSFTLFCNNIRDTESMKVVA